VVGNERGGDLVHPHAAVFLGNIHASKAQLAGLAHQSSQNTRLFSLDGRRVGQNLVAGKLRRSRGNLPLFLVQILRGKNFVGSAGFKQEAAARCRQRSEKRKSWS